MTSENLLILDPKRVNLRPAEVGPSGTNIAASTSPYDVPEALHTYKNERDGTVVLVVKYMGTDEPLETVKIGQGVEVKTGRNSKRLYEFIFHPALGFLTVNALRQAVAVLLNEDAYPRKENYRLLDDVFSSQSDKIQDILAFTNVNKDR